MARAVDAIALADADAVAAGDTRVARRARRRDAGTVDPVALAVADAVAAGGTRIAGARGRQAGTVNIEALTCAPPRGLRCQPTAAQ